MRDIVEAEQDASTRLPGYHLRSRPGALQTRTLDYNRPLSQRTDGMSKSWLRILTRNTQCILSSPSHEPEMVHATRPRAFIVIVDFLVTIVSFDGFQLFYNNAICRGWTNDTYQQSSLTFEIREHDTIDKKPEANNGCFGKSPQCCRHARSFLSNAWVGWHCFDEWSFHSKNRISLSLTGRISFQFRWKIDLWRYSASLLNFVNLWIARKDRFLQKT